MLLQQQCLQALRQHLRHASAAELQAAFLHTECPGVQLKHVPPEMPLPELLQRDVLGMVLCRLAILQEGEVYGGFVRDMLAGMHWDDVDLCFLHRHAIQRFKQTLPLYLEMLLGIPAYSFQLQLRSKNTDYPIIVHKHELIWENVVVPVDITCRSHRMAIHPPATRGSGLNWTPDGIQWRPLHCDPSTPLVAVDATVALLKRGQDILSRPSYDEWQRIEDSKREAAEAYYTRKKEEMEKRGYTLVAQQGLTLDDFLQAGT